MRHWIWGLAACVCVALVGCSRYGGDVSGTVKIGGKVATSGIVVIEDERGRTAVGSIKKDGTYVVVSPPKGACKVSLRRSPPADEAAGAGGTPDPNSTPGQPPFPIPQKYASPKTTDIEITVTDSAQTFNIERDDKLDYSPNSGAPGGSNIASGGAGRTQGSSPKAPGPGKPAGPGMPAGSGMPGMPKK
jgi:hypothetical protein